MLRIRVDAVLGKQTVGDLLSESQQAVSRAVLQCGAAVLIHNGVSGRLYLVHGEKLRRGQAAGEGDDLRLVDEREKLTDVGSLDVVHSFCEINHITLLNKNFYLY